MESCGFLNWKTQMHSVEFDKIQIVWNHFLGAPDSFLGPNAIMGSRMGQSANTNQDVLLIQAN